MEGANIKLASVATDIAGMSGRAIIAALIAGEMTPATMANVAHGRMRAKLEALAQALDGTVGAHQRFLLKQQLTALDAFTHAITDCSHEIEARMRDWSDQITRLCSIPGIGQR